MHCSHLAVVLPMILALGCSKDQPAAPAAPKTAAVDAATVAEPAWQPTAACSADGDCVPAPGCCPAPCTEHVINLADLERYRAELERSCPPPPRDCPSAGACLNHAYLCVNGGCKLVYEGEPGYRARN